MSTITSQQRDAFGVKFADIVQRLLTKDCRPEAVAAIKYEGSGTIEASFTVLGNVAGRGLMNEPHVNAGMSAFATHLDKSQFTALGKEAGIPDDPTASKTSTK